MSNRNRHLNIYLFHFNFSAILLVGIYQESDEIPLYTEKSKLLLITAKNMILA